MTAKVFHELWLCDVCRRWFPTEQIRKVPHDALQMAGANYIPWSEYHSPDWSFKGGTAFIGPLSMGMNGDFRMKVQESTTGTPQLFDATLMYAANTFQADGTGVSGIALPGPYLDQMTAWDSLCFWVEVGPKEDEASEITVEAGIGNTWYDFLTDTINHVPLTTVTTTGHSTVWLSISMADLLTKITDLNPGASLGNQLPYLKITSQPNAKFWVQNAAMSPNISTPGIFFPTTGSPVTYPVNIAYPPPATPSPGDQGPFPLFPPPPGGTIFLAATDQWTRMAVYACPSCADEVLLRRRTPGRRENRMIPPYEERET